jgi:hypothetical protein
MKETRTNEPRKLVGKKPYRKPEFRSERVFEVSALTCGKISTTQVSCHLNLKLS